MIRGEDLTILEALGRIKTIQKEIEEFSEGIDRIYEAGEEKREKKNTTAAKRAASSTTTK